MQLDFGVCNDRLSLRVEIRHNVRGGNVALVYHKIPFGGKDLVGDIVKIGDKLPVVDADKQIAAAAVDDLIKSLAVLHDQKGFLPVPDRF